ncbi:hypothetical protein C8R45DRAFT_149212 [Mycena sanguinolenta]|nr:hypothetical protein C8R45DRAFT_149212 [Mycena sanguinolenta]
MLLFSHKMLEFPDLMGTFFTQTPGPAGSRVLTLFQSYLVCIYTTFVKYWCQVYSRMLSMRLAFVLILLAMVVRSAPLDGSATDAPPSEADTGSSPFAYIAKWQLSQLNQKYFRMSLCRLTVVLDHEFCFGTPFLFSSCVQYALICPLCAAPLCYFALYANYVQVFGFSEICLPMTSGSGFTSSSPTIALYPCQLQQPVHPISFNAFGLDVDGNNVN